MTTREYMALAVLYTHNETDCVPTAKVAGIRHEIDVEVM